MISEVESEAVEDESVGVARPDAEVDELETGLGEERRDDEALKGL